MTLKDCKRSRLAPGITRPQQKSAALPLYIERPLQSHKPRCFPIPRQVDQQLPVFASTRNRASDKCPRQVSRIKIHLRRHHNLILKSRSSHHTPKSQKGRFRKSPKQRKPLLHQPPLRAPSLQRQPPTPIHPPQVLRHQDPPSQKAIPIASKPLTERRPRSAPFPFKTTQNPRRAPHEKSRASTRN